MSSVNEVLSKLTHVDWNFPRSGTESRSVHSIHWFPGNFIPQIPSFLIQILSTPGQIVLDPFAGSGTTAIEAIRLNRRAISADRVAACNFLTKAKIAAEITPLSHKFKEGILEKITWDAICESATFGSRGEGSHLQLREWYAPKTLNQLNYLWKIIEETNESDRLILELVFSDVLFACSSTAGSKTSTGKKRRHHWGWIADNVKPKPPVEHNAIRGFRDRLMALPEHEPKPIPSVFVLQHDARTMPFPDNSIDLIVTSPPYISVIDYVRANRMLYMWMGWHFDEDRAAEIGARYKRQRAKAMDEYINDMNACWKEFCRVLRPGGYCAVVIGESRAFPGVAQHTLDDLGKHLSLVWGPTYRTPSRRRVSDRSARDAIESISVFAKL